MGHVRLDANGTFVAISDDEDGSKDGPRSET